jgi:hypothetical protein
VALSDRRPARHVMMMRALSDVTLPSEPGDAFYWRSDFF